MPFEHRFDRRRARPAFESIHHPLALDEDERRNAHDLEPSREIRLLVDIDTHHTQGDYAFTSLTTGAYQLNLPSSNFGGGYSGISWLGPTKVTPAGPNLITVAAWCLTVLVANSGGRDAGAPVGADVEPERTAELSKPCLSPSIPNIGDGQS